MWENIKTIPTDKHIYIRSVTGIECIAKVQRPGGYPCKVIKSKSLKFKIQCFRKGVGDITAISWMEIGGKNER